MKDLLFATEHATDGPFSGSQAATLRSAFQTNRRQRADQDADEEDGSAKQAANRCASLREHQRFAPLNPNSTIVLPDGERCACRIPNVSASGAVVICRLRVEVKDYLLVGSNPGQVVRTTKRGFAVRFLEVQQPSTIEVALQAPLSNDKLLESLRLLAA